MNTTFLVALLLLAPLMGFLFNGIRFRSTSYKLAGTIATLASATSFLSALLLVGTLIRSEGPSGSIQVTFFEWIRLGSVQVSARFVIDALSSVMVLVVTGIGSLIHLFSIGYMSHDPRPSKYFAYLNFFLFNMLLLILGSNLLIMFIGWEGVGLCSYLLIGFWFTDREKAAAGMKAFVTNRIGDAGFLLGMFFLLFTFGTLEFSELGMLAPTPEMGWLGPVTLATLFLFVGATGKSAQIPLYVWLPDAMAGPTPVSALIHAATMVTAGVYMIVRLNPLFMAAPNTMLVIATIGGATAFFAATIGLTQWDIKKVLAYSTVSQLGYMFLAAGVGAFGAAIFHLMTHAFFKALLFLGSGSVIHAMSDEQDIRKMGGLRPHLPITHTTFFLGWLAIIGIPPLAGFFSKDEILWMAFHSPRGHWTLWMVGVLGAALTAFYMTRLMALTFWGKSRFGHDHHPHEGPWTMALPLIVLAFFSVVAGWIGIPHVLGKMLPGHPANLLEEWLKPLLTLPLLAEGDHTVIEMSLMSISVCVAGLSAFLAYYFYIVKPDLPAKIAASLGGLYTLVLNKYRVDEFYQSKLISPLVEASKGLWVYVDVEFIDRISYWITDLFREVGKELREIQNGNIQNYIMYISIGIVSVMIVVLTLGR